MHRVSNVKKRPAPRHEKALTVLNRKVRWEGDGISLEADVKHITEAVQDLDLAEAKSVVTPAVRDLSDMGKVDNGGGGACINGIDVGSDGRPLTMVGGSGNQEGDNTLLEGYDITNYRSVTARFLYLSQDRPDNSTLCASVQRRCRRRRAAIW